jgi:AcrR family transcriptional regulator
MPVLKAIQSALFDDEPELDIYTKRILAACHEQLLEFGLRRTSVEDIAKRAGVNRITIYRRFGSRDGLATALMQQEVRRHARRLVSAFHQLADPRAWIVEGFVIAVQVTSNDPLLRRLLDSDPELVLELIDVGGAVAELAVHFCAELIERLQDDGVAQAGDASVLAEALVRLIRSVALQPTNRVPVDDEQALRAFAWRALVPMVTGRQV